jgi:hypothetical protein
VLSSSVRTFTDPDEYAAAATDRGTITLTVSERGIFRGKLTHIHLHRLQMRRLSDNLARTMRADLSGELALFALRTRPGPSIIRNGGEITSTSITRAQSAENYYQRSIGGCFIRQHVPPAGRNCLPWRSGRRLRSDAAR